MTPLSEKARALGGSPAYPGPVSIGPSGEICRCDGSGLTVRQEFAKAAMQGLCANDAWLEQASEKANGNAEVLSKATAFIAIQKADALLEALVAEMK